MQEKLENIYLKLIFLLETGERYLHNIFTIDVFVTHLGTLRNILVTLSGFSFCVIVFVGYFLFLSVTQFLDKECGMNLTFVFIPVTSTCICEFLWLELGTSDNNGRNMLQVRSLKLSIFCSNSRSKKCCLMELKLGYLIHETSKTIIKYIFLFYHVPAIFFKILEATSEHFHNFKKYFMNTKSLNLKIIQ